MKNLILFNYIRPVSFLCFVMVSACSKEPKTEKEKTSYAVGREIGEDLKRRGLDFDPDIVMQAIEEVRAGQPTRMPEAEMQLYRMKGREEIVQKQIRDFKKAEEEGAQFLVRNKSEPHVIVTASGLQYEIVKEGTGASPSLDDWVTIKLKGTLVDGTEIEMLEKFETPVLTKVSALMPGLKEMLLIMKPQSRHNVVVPPALGFGPIPKGRVPPNSVLRYDLELVEIAKAPQ